MKLSIQKHKYSLPHFSSNQTNTKADTDTEREREKERERETQAQILSNLQKPNETKTEQDAILVFQNHFLEKQTDLKGRERVVT